MNNLLAHIQQGEGAKTEFKTSFQKEVIESVVAFANAKGGKEFIGIDDHGEIIGVELQKKACKTGLTKSSKAHPPQLFLTLTLNKLKASK